jgi:hypothetical protein
MAFEAKFYDLHCSVRDDAHRRKSVKRFEARHEGESDGRV